MPAYHLNATLLPNGDRPNDLWVVDGKITFAPQDRAEDLAPAGGYALCGIVDCHYHLTLDLGGIGLPAGSPELVREGLERHLASGTLLVRDMGVVSDAVHRVVNEGGALPRVQAAGTLLAPHDGYFGPQQDTTADELVGRARAQAEAGRPWVKIIADFPRKPGHFKTAPANYPLEVMKQAVEEAHAGGARVASHAVSRAGCELAVAAGVDTLEHGCMIDESLLKLMAEGGIAWTPTAIIGSHAADMAGDIGGPEALRGAREAFENQRSMLAKAYKLGITLLAGTDMFPPGSVWREVALFQQNGVEPRAALAAASTVARAFLREPALDEGAPADIVWFEHDPRNDPELLARPGLVMLGGASIP